jgi:hypothetical protein
VLSFQFGFLAISAILAIFWSVFIRREVWIFCKALSMTFQADIFFNSGNILAAVTKWLVHRAARRSSPAAEVTTMTRYVGCRQ